MSDINKIGLKARDLQSALNKYATDVKSYNQARREETARLRPLLQQVWAALENGDTVNAFRSKEAWAAWYNPTAKNPIRHIQKIIAGPKEREANSVRPASFLSRCAEAKKALAAIQLEWDADFKPGETRDMNALEARKKALYPTLNGLYEEFLKFLAPNGYEVVQGRGSWTVQSAREEKPKRRNAEQTRQEIARIKRSVGKDDGSAAWAEKYKAALTEWRELDKGYWMEVTINKAFKDVNQWIYARQRTEEDQRGWTKVGREWKHEDGRTIEKKSGRYHTYAKIDDGEPVSLGYSEPFLIDAMRKTVADMFNRIAKGLISELADPSLKEEDRAYYSEELEKVRARMLKAGLSPAAELEQTLNEVGEASKINECEDKGIMTPDGLGRPGRLLRKLRGQRKEAV